MWNLCLMVVYGLFFIVRRARGGRRDKTSASKEAYSFRAYRVEDVVLEV